MAHSDTTFGRVARAHTSLIVLALTLGFGCGESASEQPPEEPLKACACLPDASVDSSIEGPSPEGGANVPDGGEGETCEAEAKRESAFVAAHRACSVDADCVAVGDCSNADFLAVSRSAEAEAQALIDARECRAQDGPGMHAVCRNSVCELAYSAISCGEPSWTGNCPAGYRGVPTPGANGQDWQLDCRERCDPNGENSCAQGFTCQNIEVAPECEPEGCDRASEHMDLCMPAENCQLVLGIALDGRSALALHHDSAARLELTVENTTDAPVTFTHYKPCHGPLVSGLGSYDLWDECLSGACPPLDMPETLTLAAHETRVLAETLVAPSANTCNAQGLADGTYMLGFALDRVTDATVCGPSEAGLSVVPGDTVF